MTVAHEILANHAQARRLRMSPHGLESLMKPKLLDEYFGVWSIDPRRFETMVESVQGMNLVAHITANTNKPAGEPVAIEGTSRKPFALTRDGVAMISIGGPIMKSVSSLEDGTSSVFVRRQIRAAVADADVRSILLVIDSPGGTVSGTMDLAQEVRSAAAKKPLWAFAEDLTASAAYWVASQASRIVANNATSLIGSIGTYAVLTDMSQAAEDLGIKVHVIKAGTFKGTGVEGAPVTEADIEETQRIVDALNDQFLEGVAEGRSLSLDRVREIADGRIHPAADAIALGLVDAVDSLDRVAEQLSQQTIGETRMSDRATIEQLQEALPQAGADFWIGQYNQEATVEDAVRNYAEQLSSENARLVQELEEQRTNHNQEIERVRSEQPTTEPAPAAQTSTGLGNSFALGEGPAVQDGANYIGSTGDPIVDYDAAVRQLVERGMSRRDATTQVARREPELFQAFLLATNTGRKSRRLVMEKLDVEAEAAAAN